MLSRTVPTQRERQLPPAPAPPPLSEEEEEDEVEEVEEEAVCVCVFGPDIVIPTLCLWEDDVGRIIISWVVDRE